MEKTYDNGAFETDFDHNTTTINEIDQDDDKDSSHLFKEFCENTSGHGFEKIVKSSNIVRWVWVTIMIATFVGLVIHLILLLLRYYKYAVNTSIYITPDNQIIMPDITACPNQKFYFYENALGLDFNINPDIMEVYSGTTFTDLFNQYSSIWSFSSSNESSKQLARYSIMRQAYDARLLRGRNDVLININYKNTQINTNDLGLTTTIDSRVCVTFRPSIRNLNTLNGSDDTVMMLLVFFVGVDDRYEVLTKSYTEEQNTLDGGTIYVHSQNTMPNLNTDGLTCSKGYIKAISITQVNYIRQNVNNKCHDKPSDIVIRGFGASETMTYSYSPFLCVDTKKCENLYRICNCRSEVLLCSTTIPETASFCHQVPMELQRKVNGSFITVNQLASSQSETNMMSAMNQRYLCHKRQIQILDTETFPTLCLPKCTENSYKFDVSSSNMLRHTDGFRPAFYDSMNNIIPYIANANKSVDLMNSLVNDSYAFSLNTWLSILRFSPKQLTVEVTEESLSYPIEMFLSDVGGILGLYLGFSVMSMLEIGELLVQLFIHNCVKSKKKRI